MRTATLGLALLLGVAAPARAQAPSADTIVARAHTLGVGAQAERLRPRFLPGARLVRGGGARPGGTRLGGRPDLPRGMRWPSCRGHRLAFLMQIDLAELAAAAPGQVGAGGLLLVFGDLRTRPDGITAIELFYGRARPGRCVQVRHVMTPTEQLGRRRTPRRTHTLRSTPMTLQPTLTVPSLFAAEYFLQREFGRRGADAWYELVGEAATGRFQPGAYADIQHQLLGWADPIQDEPTYGCGDGPTGPPTSRRLLAQLAYDAGLRFAYGDGGVLYLTIPPSDLSAGRFTRVCAEMQES